MEPKPQCDIFYRGRIGIAGSTESVDIVKIYCHWFCASNYCSLHSSPNSIWIGNEVSAILNSSERYPEHVGNL